jgi:hypothetical protein
LTGHAVTVVRVEPATGAVSIPDRLGGRLVAGVADGVFAGCAGLTAVEAPESWYGTDKLAAAGLPAGCAVSYRGVDPLAITTSVLPEAMAGVAYETVLAASGGKTPYAWSVLGGGEYQETSAPNSFAATGTAQGWSGDDSCWDLALPFEFPFFGNTYTSVKVNSNGTLSFGSSNFTQTTYDESLFRSTPVIAVLWKDLRTDNGGNVYVESSADEVTIRWQGTYYSGGAAVNFAATLHKNGKIVLSYGSGNASGGYIGISAGDGSTVLVSAVPSSANQSNAADIVFEPPRTLPEGLTLTEGGVLSGMPDEVGEMSLTFQVKDAAGMSVEK